MENQKKILIVVSTDGGAIPTKNGQFDSASAFKIQVVPEDNGRYPIDLSYLDIQVNPNSTCQYAEIKAIESALDYTLKEVMRIALDMASKNPDEVVLDREYFKRFVIVLVTDSMNHYKSLTDWIFGWASKSKNGKWFNASGKEISHQKIISNAFNTLSMMRTLWDVRIWHINSHVADKEDTLTALKNKFEKFNNIQVSNKLFRYVYQGNKDCDTAIAEALKK